jgi:hypothetical protein
MQRRMPSPRGPVPAGVPDRPGHQPQAGREQHRPREDHHPVLPYHSIAQSVRRRAVRDQSEIPGRRPEPDERIVRGGR